MLNPFFKNAGPFIVEKLLLDIDIKNKEKFIKDKIYDIKDLITATNKDFTFLHSKKYSSLASNTKASYCITTENLKSCMEFKSAMDMLDNQKQISNNEIKPILPKFFKDNGNWIVLFPGDEGYEDH